MSLFTPWLVQYISFSFLCAITQACATSDLLWHLAAKSSSSPTAWRASLISRRRQQAASRERWWQCFSRVSFVIPALNFPWTWIYRESPPESHNQIQTRLNLLSFFRRTRTANAARASTAVAHQGRFPRVSPTPPSRSGSIWASNSMSGPILSVITWSALIATLASTATSLQTLSEPQSDRNRRSWQKRLAKKRRTRKKMNRRKEEKEKTKEKKKHNVLDEHAPAMAWKLACEMHMLVGQHNLRQGSL